MLPWSQWPEKAARRDEAALERYREELSDDVGFFAFLQYLFYDQWDKMRAYATEKGMNVVVVYMTNGTTKDGFLNMPAVVCNYYVPKVHLKLSAMYQYTGRYGHKTQLDRDNDDLGISTHYGSVQLQFSF